MSNKTHKEPEKELKVILLGESGVGKTNIINVSTGGRFNEDEITTSFSTFSKVYFDIDNYKYQVNLWDTIGQERLKQLTKLFYKNTKIVIFVYDITVKNTFEGLNYWIEDFRNQVGDDIIKGIIANKSDLFLKEEVKEEEGEEFAKSIGAKFFTFSAKNDSPKLFLDFLKDLVIDFLKSGKYTNEGRICLIKDKKKDKKCC